MVFGPITQFDASKFKTQFACEVKDFDVTKYLDRKEARKCDRYTQLAIAASEEAIADSGLKFETENCDKIGVIVSAGIGGIKHLKKKLAIITKIRKWALNSIRFYTENDCRYRIRSYLNEAWSSRT